MHTFTKPNVQLVFEDKLLNFRANILNGTLVFPDVLLEYLITDAGAWSGLISKKQTRSDLTKNHIALAKQSDYALRQYMDDISVMQGRLSAESNQKNLRKNKKTNDLSINIASLMSQN